MSRRRSIRKATRFGLQGVAAMLLLSGALRVIGGAGEARAFADESEPTVEAAAEESAIDLSHMKPGTLNRLMQDLNDRAAALDARERLLERRTSEVTAAQSVLQENLEALQLAEERLKATLARADGALEGDVGHLVKVYETMKPKEASRLFERMDAKFAAGFLARMAPTAASEVLAGMTPDAAYAISLIFAGRHVAVPTE